jgi:hypothetical protein
MRALSDKLKECWQPKTVTGPDAMAAAYRFMDKCTLSLYQAKTQKKTAPLWQSIPIDKEHHCQH